MSSLLSPKNHPHRPAPTPQVGHTLLTFISLRYLTYIGLRVYSSVSPTSTWTYRLGKGDYHLFFSFVCKKVPYHSFNLFNTVIILFQWCSLFAQTYMYLHGLTYELSAIILRTFFFHAIHRRLTIHAFIFNIRI